MKIAFKTVLKNIKNKLKNDFKLTLILLICLISVVFSFCIPTQQIEINNINSIIKSEMLIPNISHPGGYRVSIVFDNNIEESNVSFSCDDNRYLSQDSSGIIMDKDDSFVEGAFYITGVKNHGPIKMLINSENGVMIESVTIKESLSYRVSSVLFIDSILITSYIAYCFFFKSKYSTQTKLIVLISVVAIILSSLLSLGGTYYKVDDYKFHELRILSLADYLVNRSGEEIKYIYPIGLNGYNYILPVFYCDILLVLPAILYNLLIPFHTCYNVYIIAINILTYIICFYAMRKIIKVNWIALVTSSFYLLAQHRIFIIYSTFGVGSYTAYTFVPLIILGMYNILTADKISYKEWLPLSVGMALIIQSHMLTTFMVVLYLGIFSLVYFKKLLEKERIISLIKSATLCILLTAWFLVPFLLTMRSNKLVTTIWKPDILMTVLKPRQLFSEINAGFDAFIGFQSIVVFIISFYVLFSYKKKDSCFYRMLKTTFILACITVLLVTTIFPWRIIIEIIPQIAFIQFTRRFVPILLALLTICLGISLKLLKETNCMDIIKISLIIISIFTIINLFNYYDSMRNNYKESKQYRLYKSYINSGANMYDYTPINFLDGYKIYRDRSFVYDSKKINLISSYKNGPSMYINLENRSNEESSVELPIVYLTYYRAVDELTGNPVEVFDNYGFLGLKVDSGFSGTIKVYFSIRKIWRVANMLSLSSALSLAIFLVFKNIKEIKSRLVNHI